ncbi:uncharacterized protein FYW61_005962 [Anableps anableps]
MPCRMEEVRLQVLPSVFIEEHLGKQQSSVCRDWSRPGDHQQPGGNELPEPARSPAEVLDRAEANVQGSWMEVDRWKFSRSHVGAGRYGLSQQPSGARPSRTQSCAAFNSFLLWSVRSWSSELCSQQLQWLCEKKASASGRLY